MFFYETFPLPQGNNTAVAFKDETNECNIKLWSDTILCFVVAIELFKRVKHRISALKDLGKTITRN